jgi:lipopolysaccharide transport protein LptA
MTVWQRRVRLVIAMLGLAVAVFVARQFRPRVAPSAQAPSARADPTAIAEVTGGGLVRFSASRQDVAVKFRRQQLYADGSMKLFGVNAATDERGGTRSFTVSGDEGHITHNESVLTLDGGVEVTASDGLTVHTDHAVYNDHEGLVRAPGPVQFSRGRLKGSGVGMTYDKNRDILIILQQAVVNIAPDSDGAGAADVTSTSAEFARRDRYARFTNGVRIVRGGEAIVAPNAVAYLTEDGERIDTLDLRDGARMTVAAAAPGALQSMGSTTMNLKYAPDGQALEHALLVGNAAVQFAGDAGKAGRQITAGTLDIGLAPDGSTPVLLAARERVQLVMPADAGTAARNIQSANLDATGAPGKGLTNARFSGSVRFLETGQTNRAARSETLDVVLKAGISDLEDARFKGGVRFEEGKQLVNAVAQCGRTEDGRPLRHLVACAAAARYDLAKGTLELSGSEPDAPVPRVMNERIAVDAAKIDVTLEGPRVAASGSPTDKVKSVLQPAPKEPSTGPATVKLPSMLKQDQPVNVTAVTMDYDGATSKTVYDGSAQLWQGDTSIKGEKLEIDGKAGDLGGKAVTSATVLDQTGKDGKKDRVRSTATAKDFKYDDGLRRLTYTGDAHMIGPEGDMTAATIELYLKPSGNELDRAEAYEAVTLREQNRKTTGTRMTYTTADERYFIVGAPVKIVDQCDRETTGRTLTFQKATDRIVVDGNQETRTHTKGGGKCS